jgi:hypothetical protein
MSDTLIICPTIRKDKALVMFESLLKTCDADILFLTEVGNTTQLINEAFHKNSFYKYYHLTNDDFIYQTKDWDKIFINSILDGGIAHGNDLYLGEALPVAPFISGDVARAVGWLQLPTLTHLCGDMVWNHIGRSLGILKYHKEVIIEHKHFLNHKAEKDSVYEITNSKEMYAKDHAACKEWIANQSADDIARIRLALSQVRESVGV